MYKQLKELRDLLKMLQALSLSGTCDTGMAGSTTVIVCAQLANFEADRFNTGYSMVVLRNANSVGNAPEGQFRDITDYVASTGTFTTAAFGANVEEGDLIAVMKNELADLADGGRLDLIFDTIAAAVAGLGGAAMRGTDGAALVASGWDAGLATILDNFSAARIGYLDQLDFALQEAIAARATAIGAEFDGTPDLYDVLVTGGIPAWPAAAAPANNISIAQVVREIYNQVVAGAGVPLPFQTTVDLHNAAGTYDVATATAQDILVTGLVFHTRLDISDDAAITGISIQTDHTTSNTLIPVEKGIKANLGAEAQLFWEGKILLRVGDKIQLTIIGGTATVDPSTCDVVITYQSIVAGGTLA